MDLNYEESDAANLDDTKALNDDPYNPHCEAEMTDSDYGKGSETLVIAKPVIAKSNCHTTEIRNNIYADMSDKVDETGGTGKDQEDIMQDKEKIPVETCIDKLDKVEFNEGDVGNGTEDSALGTSRERVLKESEHVHLEEHGRRSSRTPKPRVVYFAELPPVSHTGHANNSNHGHGAGHNHHSTTRNNNSNSTNTTDDSHTNEDGDDDNEMPDSQSGLGSALPAVRKFFSTRLEQVVTFLGGHKNTFICIIYISFPSHFHLVFILIFICSCIIISIISIILSSMSFSQFPLCLYKHLYLHFYLYICITVLLLSLYLIYVVATISYLCICCSHNYCPCYSETHMCMFTDVNVHLYLYYIIIKLPSTYTLYI